MNANQGMNLTHQFWNSVLLFLILKSKDSLEKSRYIVQISDLRKKCGTSYPETLNIIQDLEYILAERIGDLRIRFDDAPCIGDILAAAFTDLSKQKNPDAMKTFRKIEKLFTFTDIPVFLWAKLIKKRPDGSVIVTLHISNWNEFRDSARIGVDDEELKNGVMR